MHIDHQVGQPADGRDAMVANPAAGFTHPADVVEDPALTLAEKRATLASWVSDANAVPDRPWLRQLPNGFQVPVREIVDALKALDDLDAGLSAKRILRRNRHSPSDDDDDPPPSPIGARPPRQNGPGGPLCGGAAELIAA